MLNHKITKVIATLAVLIFMAACSAKEVANQGVDQLGIKNLNNPAENIYSSGQPTKKQLESLAKLGVKNIVNLRPAKELNWDEAAFVSSLGMQYHLIPVDGAAGINVENATKLNLLLEKLKVESTLVHCSSSNRVGALIALEAKFKGGQTVEEAVELGRGWGLKGLEPLVREKLANYRPN